MHRTDTRAAIHRVSLKFPAIRKRSLNCSRTDTPAQHPDPNTTTKNFGWLLSLTSIFTNYLALFCALAPRPRDILSANRKREESAGKDSLGEGLGIACGEEVEAWKTVSKTNPKTNCRTPELRGGTGATGDVKSRGLSGTHVSKRFGHGR